MSIEITSVTLKAPVAAAERGGSDRMPVEVEVRNTTSTKSYHVWSSLRAFDYDAESRTLRLALADEPVERPVEIISEHPRTPHQIVVEPGATATISVPVPTVIKRLPDQRRGLGAGLAQEPLGEIDQVDVTVAYADTPYQPRSALSPREIREQLIAWGNRAHAQMKPSTEQSTRRRRPRRGNA
jgi:hypothetical protein